MLVKSKEKGILQRGQKDSLLFNNMVKQFVINTIDMVKNNIHEEQNIIDQMLTLLQQKTLTICRNAPSDLQPQTIAHRNNKQNLQQIQSAVEQLSKDSDILSERLFDLSQTLIQNKIAQVERQKQQSQRSYENRLLKLKHNFQNQKSVLQSELKHYKEKCRILEDCLSQREQFIVRQQQRVQQNRKQQLVKFLQAIESIYEQLEAIKNFSNQPILNRTQSIQHYPTRHYDNYSQQYYNTARENQQTQARSNQYKFNQNYYCNNMDKRSQTERMQAERRSISKNTNIQPRYVQIPLPRQNYYINSENNRKERSKSTNRIQLQSDFNSKIRPIIIQYQQSPQIKPNLKESQIYTRRSLKLDSQSEQKRVEQKNLRMQGVQQKLHGLKRKLSRQLKNMKK